MIPAQSSRILPTLVRGDSGLKQRKFDQEYVSRLAECDPGTERDFVDYFGDLLHIKLRRKLRSRQQIEDVRQEVFLRVLTQIRKKGGLEKPESLGAFVHTVCNNVVLELINKNRRDPPARPPAEQTGGSPLPRPEPVDPELNPERRLISKERTKQVQAIIESLPPRDRKILIRIFPEERDRTDVCREFGITPENLRVLLHRALRRFRQAYESRSNGLECDRYADRRKGRQEGVS